LKLFQEEGKGGVKENDGGDEFNYDAFKELVNVTMCPKYNNNIIFLNASDGGVQ
jgi:hypothetical protein